jgi:hypothetical protein
VTLASGEGIFVRVLALAVEGRQRQNPEFFSLFFPAAGEREARGEGFLPAE